MKTIDSNKDVTTIGFRELREKSDKIIADVEAGKSFLVKRKSKALFRIVPVEEEVWNTVIDFTEIDPEGVPIGEVISAIEELKREQPEKYGRQNKKIPR
jgi:antitoxin (DNA-binding transcriptional repressor) of toxin-antitoxin stability system